MTYFVIFCGPNGPYIRTWGEEDLKLALEEKNWGDNPRFVESFDAFDITEMEFGQVIIIKGTIVRPKTRQVTEHYID